MPLPSVTQLAPVLMTAIGPAILISAVGLLLLTLTNRFSHVVDRSRELDAQLDAGQARPVQAVAAQLRILLHRAQLLRTAIILAATSALCAALLVIVLFVTALFHLDGPWLVILLFVACMGSLSASLTVFLRELNQALVALRLETTDTLDRVRPA
jgi:hypothetical protein